MLKYVETIAQVVAALQVLLRLLGLGIYPLRHEVIRGPASLVLQIGAGLRGKY